MHYIFPLQFQSNYFYSTLIKRMISGLAEMTVSYLSFFSKHVDSCSQTSEIIPVCNLIEVMLLFMYYR